MRIAVSRAPGAERVVTPLEHVDLRTGAETVIMAPAIGVATSDPVATSR